MIRVLVSDGFFLCISTITISMFSTVHTHIPYSVYGQAKQRVQNENAKTPNSHLRNLVCAFLAHRHVLEAEPDPLSRHTAFSP